MAFASKKDVPNWQTEIFEFDPAFERQLLLSFLERNHLSRTQDLRVAWRPSSLACDLGSGSAIMKRGAKDWVDADPALHDIKGKPDLLEAAQWFSEPALLRTLRAHSDETCSVFAKTNAKALNESFAGNIWCWSPKGERLVPSLEVAAKSGRFNWFFMRSLFESQRVAKEPAFYVHTGCDGISPTGATHRPYDHPEYSAMQAGESILFFGEGLALVGRSKVFYDEPREFAETLAKGESFGAAWARYFELESNASSFGKVGGDIGRKRSYFWSVLGDWTLTLQMGKPSR
jgi:hypothetical protein